MQQSTNSRLQCNFGAENANIAVIDLAKVSILLFYRSIFIQSWFKLFNTILVVTVTCFTLAIMLCVIFSKWPVYDQWDPLVPYNSNNAAVLISFLVLNVRLRHSDLGSAIDSSPRAASRYAAEALFDGYLHLRKLVSTGAMSSSISNLQCSQLRRHFYPSLDLCRRVYQRHSDNSESV